MYPYKAAVTFRLSSLLHSRFSGETTNSDSRRKATPGHFSTWKSYRGSISNDQRSHFSSVENVSYSPQKLHNHALKIDPL